MRLTALINSFVTFYIFTAKLSLASEDDPCSAALAHIKAGQLAQAEQALSSCDKLGEIEDTLSLMKRKLQDVSQKVSQLKNRAANVAPIEPAMQWAQSPDSVFINVKFAHKLDAPACIDLIDPSINIEESRVMVTAGCKGSDKHFKLDLVLFSSIVSANSSWSMTSVGRGSFTLAKQAQAKWDRLLASRDKPKNLHVWWAMQEKHDDALDALKHADAEKPVKREVDEDNKTENNDAEQATAKEDAEEKEEAKEDPLAKDFVAARKRVEDQAKKAKREIEDKARSKKAKLKKEIESVDEEESRHISKLEAEKKSAIGKLTVKYDNLKARRDKGETVEWGEDDDISATGEHKEGSFLAAAAKVLKKAFGVGETQPVKDEV